MATSKAGGFSAARRSRGEHFKHLNVVVPPAGSSHKLAVVEVGRLRTPAGYRAAARPPGAASPTREHALTSRPGSSVALRSDPPARRASALPRLVLFTRPAAGRDSAGAASAASSPVGEGARPAARRPSILERLRLTLVPSGKRPPRGKPPQHGIEPLPPPSAHDAAAAAPRARRLAS